MASLNSRIEALERVADAKREIRLYREDLQQPGMFRDSLGRLLTRAEVTQDARDATAILIVYETQQEALDVPGAQVQLWLPHNHREDDNAGQQTKHE